MIPTFIAILFAVLLIALGVYAALIDARQRIIPNEICIGVALLGLLFQLFYIDLQAMTAAVRFALGVLVAGVVFEYLVRVISKAPGIGLGDIKYIAAWTCALSVRVLPALALASLTGALFSIVRHERTFAFGPWLSAAFSVALIAILLFNI